MVTAVPSLLLLMIVGDDANVDDVDVNIVLLLLLLLLLLSCVAVNESKDESILVEDVTVLLLFYLL